MTLGVLERGVLETGDLIFLLESVGEDFDVETAGVDGWALRLRLGEDSTLLEFSVLFIIVAGADLRRAGDLEVDGLLGVVGRLLLFTDAGWLLILLSKLLGVTEDFGELSEISCDNGFGEVWSTFSVIWHRLSFADFGVADRLCRSLLGETLTGDSIFLSEELSSLKGVRPPVKYPLRDGEELEDSDISSATPLTLLAVKKKKSYFERMAVNSFAQTFL